jgi:hypothetical protein
VTEAKIGYDLAVRVYICSLEIVEEATPSADHLQQATPAVMIFHVQPKMVREEVDSLCKQNHLNSGGSRVCRVLAIILEVR